MPERRAHARRRSDAHLRAAFEASADGIIGLDEHGCIVSCNPMVWPMFGYAPDQLVGRALTELLPELDLHSQSRQELEGRRCDGTRITVELTLGQAAYRDRYVHTAVLRDVTERRRMRSRLEHRARRDRQLSPGSVVAFARFLERHRDAICDAWLARVSEWIVSRGQSREVLRNDVPHILDRIAASIERGHEHEELRAIVREHGALRHRVGFDLHQLMIEYRLLRDVVLEQYWEAIGDVEQPSVEGLARFHQYIDTAIVEAVEHYVSERDRTRELFISILGHDLRSPLNTIAMAAEALLRTGEPLGERQVTWLSRMSRATGRMRRMIDDLLDLARARMGTGFPIEPEPLDLRELVSEAIRDVQAIHPNRDIRSRVHETQADARGSWDRGLIVQAITNMLDNAVEHGTEPIVVDLVDRGEELVIRFDNGGEMPHEARDRMLDPFAHPPSRRQGGLGRGLGLGLYIGHEVVRSHGGRVEVESSAEHGTRVELVLPRHAGPAR